MSTTTERHLPVRVPGRILKHDCWRADRAPTGGPAEGAANNDARVRELTGYRLARLEAEVLAPARANGSADQRLRRLISSYVTLAITDPGIMMLLSSRPQGPGGEAQSPAVRDAIGRFVRTLEDGLGSVMKIQERAPSISPEVAAQSLLGIIHWGVSSHRDEGRLSRDEAAAQITFLALHGLVSQQPAVRRRSYPRRYTAA